MTSTRNNILIKYSFFLYIFLFLYINIFILYILLYFIYYIIYYILYIITCITSIRERKELEAAFFNCEPTLFRKHILKHIPNFLLLPTGRLF